MKTSRMATRRNKQDRAAAVEVLLARNLRAARDLAGLSQRELGTAADLDPQQISKWERGALKPSTPSLLALAEALNRDLAWFYTDHEPKEIAA